MITLHPFMLLNMAKFFLFLRAAAGLAERLSPEYHFGEILERAILEVLKEVAVACDVPHQTRQTPIDPNVLQ